MKKLKSIVYNQLKKYEKKHHQLNYLFWECTTQCNLNCIHCGSDCTKDASVKDMPLNDFLSAVDTITSIPQNCTVVLTGGEPLLRSDIEECGINLRKRGMRWGIVSNGSLYTEERHNSLLNAGMGALTISLDGMEENHNWMRQLNSSFRSVSKAIDLAVLSSRLNFDIVTCVNKRNISQLDEIYAFLNIKKVKNWRLFTIVPIGRAKAEKDLFLSSDEMKCLMEMIVAFRKRNDMNVSFSCEGFVGKYELEVRDAPFFCRAGINIGSVLIDGGISACPNIDRSFIQGNIYKDNLYQVWQNEFQQFRSREWTMTGQCKNCNSYSKCEGNGMHYWHGAKENVIQCHNSLLQC